jgi:hypothetical protein
LRSGQSCIELPALFSDNHAADFLLLLGNIHDAWFGWDGEGCSKCREWRDNHMQKSLTLVSCRLTQHHRTYVNLSKLRSTLLRQESTFQSQTFLLFSLMHAQLPFSQMLQSTVRCQKRSPSTPASIVCPSLNPPGFLIQSRNIPFEHSSKSSHKNDRLRRSLHHQSDTI